MTSLPTGTVTFLFTDIEGSTRLWEKYSDGMKSAVARHEEIIRTAIEAHGGYVFKTVGDAFCAAFGTAPDALEATLEAQRALSGEEWGETGPLKVRASLHTGAAEERGGDYFGPPVNRVARLLSAGHGGQVILSQPTYDLVRDDLPESTSLSDMGEHRLKDLARPEHVFQLVAPELPADFAPLKTLDTRPNNLPAQPTPLIGREKEAEAVSELLLRDDVRLVTLTGPGGTGKTRLGLQVAADMIEVFEDGVFFVSLDPITDVGLVASTIAHTLGVQESGGQPILESLKNYLQGKEILLLLDNFEQVTSAAPLISDLLATCPKMKVLVTSREVLHLQGEREYQVSPLSLPDLESLPSVEVLTQYESVELFIERALAVKADFAVTNENAPAVAEICHRLDGLPLAIELAAARIKLLTPKAILTRLSSRMKLLTGGARDLPARQQTIQNTIAWSYDLLDDEEKKLFRRLSVFVGGCTLEAVEEICNAADDLEVDILDSVASLVDKSLLKQEEVEDEARFVMLETVREYGLERLAESEEKEALRRNHSNFYLAMAKEVEPELHRHNQVMWMDQLEVEHDNLRAVLEWSLESGEVENALRLSCDLWWFWFIRGYFSEGLDWMERALSLDKGISKSVRARALTWGGCMAWWVGDLERMGEMLRESLALSRQLGDKVGLGWSLNFSARFDQAKMNYDRAVELGEESLKLFQEVRDKFGTGWSYILLGDVARSQGDNERAVKMFEGGLIPLRELGDKNGIAWLVQNIGDVRRQSGDYDLGAELIEESIVLFQELGDKFGTAGALRNLGVAISFQGNYSRAVELLEESISLLRGLGDRRVVYSLAQLGRVVRYQGDFRRTTELLRESLTLGWELGDTWTIAFCLENFASLAGAQEQLEQGSRLFGAAEALREVLSIPIPLSDRDEHDRSLAAVRASLGEEAFAAAWAEGRKMSMEEAIDYALKVDDA